MKKYLYIFKKKNKKKLENQISSFAIFRSGIRFLDRFDFKIPKKPNTR